MGINTVPCQDKTRVSVFLGYFNITLAIYFILANIVWLFYYLVFESFINVYFSTLINLHNSTCLNTRFNASWFHLMKFISSKETVSFQQREDPITRGSKIIANCSKTVLLVNQLQRNTTSCTFPQPGKSRYSKIILRKTWKK